MNQKLKMLCRAKGLDREALLDAARALKRDPSGNLAVEVLSKLDLKPQKFEVYWREAEKLAWPWAFEATAAKKVGRN
jgi:hypothetical protein